VTRGGLTISVTESGTIQNRDKEILYSRVEGRTTIVSLVDEGTHARKGDLLIELDSSKLEETRITQDITVQNAESSWVQARENLEIARNQATADVQKAELDLKFARLDREKYEKGEYVIARQEADAKITLAGEEVKKAEDQYEWSAKLAEQGFITRTELLTDELALKRKRIELDSARKNLEVLEAYTHVRDREKKSSDVTYAEMALERARRKARADVVKAETDARAKEAERLQQKAKLDKTLAQIEACRIVAPADGLVVFPMTAGPRWGGNREPLRVGQEVSERQELIHLPVSDAMDVDVKVQESNLRKVQPGQAAIVRVDAIPNEIFRGKLTKIALLPDATRAWLNPDLKVYNCTVALDTSSPKLRPGMSCRVEIVVQELADAVYVPLQAVVRVGQASTVQVVRDGKTTPREVTTGQDNNRVVHILAGLNPGEVVWLTPPLAEGETAQQTAVEPPLPPEPGGVRSDNAGPARGATNGAAHPPRNGRRRAGPPANGGAENRPSP
jgi:HlyD family secretion protein